MLNVKKDFPIFNHHKDLVYLDNGATTQKPKMVIDAISNYYSQYNANVHRGIYEISEKSTEMYEKARETVANFIGANSPKEIIFTKGSTESLNRVAIGWALRNLKEGDELITTDIEHHSNFIPWQIVAKKTGATLKIVECTKTGELPLEKFKEAITPKTRLIAITHISNVLGTVLPIKEITKLAKRVNAYVCVDGAQAVPHIPVNVLQLGCDFYAFSGHKLLGPMGIGVLWAKEELLTQMSPYEYGGGMIKTVTTKESTWAEIPEKFEAGTPNVAGAIGLAKATEYLRNIGMSNVQKHTEELVQYAITKLSKIEKVEIVGPPNKTGLVSFTIKGLHPHDLAAVLSAENVAVRAGLHCAIPLHEKLNLPGGSVRASFHVYNDKKDIDKLILGIQNALKILGG